MGSRTSTVSRKNVTVINFARSHAQIRVSIGFSCTVTRRFEFQSVFRALSWKFKILAIPDVLDHGKSYEHGFTKKRKGHKLLRSCEQNRVSIGFLCTVSKI
ncbi:hypothetical protein GW17_00051429 [Ensete ventricosum]|nr:hypothetical protein GW17_00051429 [Ensete ventricosum]